MGLRDELTEALAEAFSDPDGLLDAVTEFTGSRVTGEGTYNPVTEEWTPGTLTYTGRGVLGGFAIEMVDGVNILRTDVKLTALQAEVARGDASETPAVDDTINGMKVISIGADAAKATHLIQLRKV